MKGRISLPTKHSFI